MSNSSRSQQNQVTSYKFPIFSFSIFLVRAYPGRWPPNCLKAILAKINRYPKKGDDSKRNQKIWKPPSPRNNLWYAPVPSFNYVHTSIQLLYHMLPESIKFSKEMRISTTIQWQNPKEFLAKKNPTKYLIFMVKKTFLPPIFKTNNFAN